LADADKPIEWAGSSLEDLTDFPDDAKKIAGHQLRRIQKGLMPDNWKPMAAVGPGAQEIVIDTGDAFRVFYVAKFDEAVHVLHAFQKKTRKTSPGDIALGKKRYNAVIRARNASAVKGKTK
jgi:phage-related protein